MYWISGESQRLQGVEAGQCAMFQPCLGSILPDQGDQMRWARWDNLNTNLLYL
jgi:hypothetical protein